MTPEQLEAVGTVTAERARAMFLERGQHAPIALVFEADGSMTAALLAVEAPAHRRAFFEAACAHGAQAIVFITEGWMATARVGVDLEALELWKRERGSFESLPGREEVLALWAVCPGGAFARHWRIERGEGVRLVPLALESPTGILTDLPWRTAAA